MASYDYDLIVIGGGAAGLTVAAGAARLGAKVLLAEKGEALGGDCLHHGCVPSKTLIATARLYHLMGRAREFGLPAVERPAVDFREVRRRIRQVISTIQRHDSVERFCSLGVRVEFGQPEFVDDHTIRLNGRRWTASKFCIATGSSPSAPPVEGLDQVPHLTNRELFSLDQLPQRLVILGGGPIAVEMAQAFSRLGSSVTVIQRSGQILKREDEDMAKEVQAALEKDGVRFLLNTAIERVERRGHGVAVVVRRKGQEAPIEVEGDRLLVALGRAANVEGLGLEEAGVEFTPRGIQVDARLRTSRPHIFAAGDVIGRFQFTHAAGYEGGVVVANAIFHVPRKVDYTHMPWCTYTDPELASLGLNEKRAQEAGLEYRVIEERFSENDRAICEGATAGKVKLILDAKARPLGVQILGPRAGDLLAQWVSIFTGGVKLATVASAVQPYPTLGEITKRAAGTVLSEKLFSETVKKGLRFFFSLKGRACGVEP